MAITLGVHASAGSSNGNTSVTPARNVTTGSCLVAVIGWGGGTAGDGTLTDNAGNTWEKIGISLGPTSTGNYSVRGVLYACEDCIGSASFVLTATRSGEYPSVAYQEYLGTSVEVEAVASGPQDPTTPWTSNTVLPAANGAGLFSGFVNNANVNPTYGVASPFSVQEGVTDMGAYYPLAAGAGVQTTAAAVAASWTMGTATGAGLVWTVALREATGGTSYTLAADGAAFSVTGAAADLRASHGIVAESGTFALTGADATLTYDEADSYTLSAEAGSYTLTGAATGLLFDRRVVAEVGAFIWSGGTGVPTLGSHVLEWDYEGSGTDPHTSAPITTISGSTLQVEIGVANGLDVAPEDNMGNTFARVGSRINYTLWSGYGVSVWRATDIVGGAGHTVTVQKDLSPTAEISMQVTEIRGTTSNSGGMSEELTGDPLVSAPVTTTGPALLLASWWGDHSAGPFTAVAGDDFVPLDSALDGLSNYIQVATAYKTEPSAGTYSVEWTETPDQGALLGLFAFEGGTGETNLRVDRRLDAEAGAFTLAGADITLIYEAVESYSLTAETGTYAVSGSAVSLAVARLLAADGASYGLSGTDAQLLLDKWLVAEAGGYSLTGAEAGLLYTPAGTYAISADAGGFAVSGSPAELIYTPALTYTLVAGTAVYSLTGGDVGWQRTYRLGAGSATYIVTGLPAGLFYSLDTPPLVPIVTYRPDSFADGPVYRPTQTTFVAERP